jgi:hypothetical protein
MDSSNPSYLFLFLVNLVLFRLSVTSSKNNNITKKNTMEFVDEARSVCPSHYEIEFAGQLPTKEYIVIYKPRSSHPELVEFGKHQWRAMAGDVAPCNSPKPRLYKCYIGAPGTAQIKDVVEVVVYRGSGVKYHLADSRILWRGQLDRTASFGFSPSPPKPGSIPTDQFVRILVFPQ